MTWREIIEAYKGKPRQAEDMTGRQIVVRLPGARTAKGMFAAVPTLGTRRNSTTQSRPPDQHAGRRPLAVGVPGHRVGGDEQREEVAPQRDGEHDEQLRTGHRRGDHEHRGQRRPAAERERGGRHERAEDDGPLRTERRGVVEAEAQVELGEGRDARPRARRPQARRAVRGAGRRRPRTAMPGR